MRDLCLVLLAIILAACDPVTPSGGTDAAPGDVDGRSDSDARPNQAPTGIELSDSSIPERAAPGTVIGTLSAIDPDSGDSHTFALSDSVGGRFAVEGNELRVADGDLLNYEAAVSHDVTIEVTDGAGGSTSETFTIELIDVLEVANLNDTGPGSLRQAIADVTPGETILFELGLGGPIDLQTPLVISKNLLLRGNPGGNVLLNGRTVVRVLQVDTGAAVTLQDLVIQQGSASSGACVTNSGELTLERVAVRSCRVSSSSGRGGGVQNFGTLAVVDSVFEQNAAFNGGGITNDNGRLDVIGSTFVSNTTTGNSAGAILSDSTQGATIINSTFVSNEAVGGVGGAIAVFGGQIAVVHCTVTDGKADRGGGIYVGGAETLTIRGTIVANNSVVDPGTGTGPDIQTDGTTISNGYNVVTVGGGSGLVNGTNNDQVNVTQPMNPLVNNGGPTPTRTINTNTPAYNSIPTADCLDDAGDPLTVDQRGQPRPANGSCDAGAVEIQ
jgi:hypothetical protein